MPDWELERGSELVVAKEIDVQRLVDEFKKRVFHNPNIKTEVLVRDVLLEAWDAGRAYEKIMSEENEETIK